MAVRARFDEISRLLDVICRAAQALQPSEARFGQELHNCNLPPQQYLLIRENSEAIGTRPGRPKNVNSKVLGRHTVLVLIIDSGKKFFT
jgi:hypothetical protein